MRAVLSPIRYPTFAIRPSLTLPQHQEDVVRSSTEKTAVPPDILASVLTQLQEATGFPFMPGWQVRVALASSDQSSTGK